MESYRIPSKYDYDSQEVVNAISSVVPGVEIVLNSNGKLLIHKNITATQKQQIKAAVIPLLTEHTDITV